MPVADEVMMYVVVLLMLTKPRDSLRTDAHLLSRDLHVDITVSPPAPQLMLVGSRLTISVVVTSVDNWTCEGQLPACRAPAVMMSASTRRPMTVGILAETRNPHNNTLIGLMPLPRNQSIAVVVNAMSVGRAVLVLEISAASATQTKVGSVSADSAVGIQYAATVENEVEGSEGANSAVATDGGRHRSSRSSLPAVIQYHITVTRQRITASCQLACSDPIPHHRDSSAQHSVMSACLPSSSTTSP